MDLVDHARYGFYGLYSLCHRFVVQLAMRFALFSTFGLWASTILTQPSLVDKYVATETPRAAAGMIANIGPSGAKCSGAAVVSRRISSQAEHSWLMWTQAGIVIASPNIVNPDYLYSWVRDASLVFKTIVDKYTAGTGGYDSMRTLIDDFVSAEAGIQQVSNTSGTVSTGGLGEPKVSFDVQIAVQIAPIS
jgi:glucoamylase